MILCNAYRKEAADSIAHICSISMAPNKAIGGPYIEWLYAVPLLHQLKYQDETTKDIDPDEPDWGINGLDQSKLSQFKDFIQNEKYVYIYIYNYVCISVYCKLHKIWY